MYDYSRLRADIVFKFGTMDKFAAAMGMSKCTLSKKLNNRSEWTGDEMVRACQLLGKPLTEMHQYFFCIEC